MRLGLMAALVLVVSAVGCAPVAEEDSPAHAAFSYEGETGPERWGSLSEEFRACDEGAQQSPIDLAGAAAGPLPELAFDYDTTDLELVHTGHAIQANPAPGSGIVLDGVRYDLVQFHFHVPSEHAFDGRPLDGEVHYVHAAADGNLAVVGVGLVAGEPHPALERIVAALPAGPEAEPLTLTGFTLDGFLPGPDTTFRYPGSLTTPPCTEGVRWVVFTEPVEADAGQLGAFTDVLDEGHNARPLQPRNDRELLTDAEEG